MSVEPPSSGRPTGPPSGPLSGGNRPPPAGPPPQSPGGSSMAGGPEPHRPWWRSVPRIAAVTAAVVAAVVLAVVFTRPDGGSSAKGGEVFLQSAAKTGPDPYTESTAKDSSVPPPPTSGESSSAPANAVRGVDGGAPGLYGGTQNSSSCDVEKMIKDFQADPAKNKSFASVAGVQPSGVPAYLRSLTPVQLRVDTRVTNHGYRNGAATSYQAVLQAGTAVLVDGHGVPRVRCACGNPLTPPVALKTTPKPTGDHWASYRPSNVVVVTPAPQIIKVFVIYDPGHHSWFHRHRGDHGRHDQHVKPPKVPLYPWNPPGHPGCASPGTTGKPGSSPMPCPLSSSPSASSSSPSSESSSASSESSSSESSSSSSESSGSSTPPSESSKSQAPTSETPTSASPSSSSPTSSGPPSSSPAPGTSSQTTTSGSSGS
ncbi:DUF6777 domain-containing protein [Streptomyces sp. NPDC047028]|uniref:DUF6777 domain-containing protein n=1 Tax=Streptomyces sp. NPDC047028 TaxID=3155793 RepID=UPI0033EF21C1